MAVAGTLGARLYISNTPLVDIEAAADSIADFSGLTYDNEVGLIENVGEVGRVFDLATFQAVADGRMFKLKAGFNDGQMAMTVGQDLSDAGQAALRAYANSPDQNTYPVKITLNGADASFDTMYFGVKVMSFRTQLGAANTVIKAAVQLEVNTPLFIGAS